MRLEIFQIDAFTDKLFSGNPAAVVPLEKWLPEMIMQAIAAENNLSETAFYVPLSKGRYGLRWFTPEAEVALCGHATLATTHLLFSEKNETAKQIIFETKRSGELLVAREAAGRYRLDLPAYQNLRADGSSLEDLESILGKRPREIFNGEFLMAVFDDVDDILHMQPDYNQMTKITHHEHPGSVLVTAPGGVGVDFVSRFFAPGLGILEDPVTGSAHCQLTPFWGARLGKDHLQAAQISPRGGQLGCILSGDRVLLEGAAVTYMRGTLEGMV